MSTRRKNAKASTKNQSTGTPGIALYHVVKADETFDDAAEALLEILRLAGREQPGVPRLLFLDIEGHRNEQGGFDGDMYELQVHFITGFLSRWLTEFSTPLAKAKNTKPQEEDIPDHLMITPGGPSADRHEKLVAQAATTGLPTYDSETGDLVYGDGRREKR